MCHSQSAGMSYSLLLELHHVCTCRNNIESCTVYVLMYLRFATESAVANSPPSTKSSTNMASILNSTKPGTAVQCKGHYI